MEGSTSISSVALNTYATKKEFQWVGRKLAGKAEGYIARYQKTGETFLLKEGDPNALPLPYEQLEEFNAADNSLGTEYITQSIFREIFGEQCAPNMLLVSKQNELLNPDGNHWMLASKWESIEKSTTFATSFLRGQSPFKGLAKLLTLCELLHIRDFKPEHILQKSSSNQTHSMIVGSSADFSQTFESINELFDNLLTEREERVSPPQNLYRFKKKKVLKVLENFTSLSPTFIDSLANRVRPLMHEGFLKDYVERIKLLQQSIGNLLSNHQNTTGSHVPHVPFYSTTADCVTSSISRRDLVLLNDLFENGFEEKTIFDQFERISKSPYLNLLDLETIETKAPSLFNCWKQGSFENEQFPRTSLAIRCGINILKYFLISYAPGNFYEYELQFSRYLKSEERQKIKHTKEEIFLLIDCFDAFRWFTFTNEVFEELLTTFKPKLEHLPYLRNILMYTERNKNALFFFRLFLQIEDPKSLKMIDQSIAQGLRHYPLLEDFDHLSFIMSKHHNSSEVFVQLLTILSILAPLDKNKIIFKYADIFLLPLLKYHGNLFIQSPDEMKEIASMLLDILGTRLTVLSHTYDKNYNKNDEKTIKVWVHLSRLGILKAVLWRPDLPVESLHANVKKLHQLIQLINDQYNRQLHTETNTLKALCYFIPNANPQFKLTDNETFDLVLYILKTHNDANGLKIALLFLDIFSPAEARCLYEFYLQNRRYSPLPLDCSDETPSQTLPSITPSEFKKLDTEEQQKWIYYLNRMRLRDTQIAHWVLRHRRDHAGMCLEALNWLSTVHKELSPADRKSLLDIIAEHPSLPVRQSAIRCLKTTLHQKESPLLKSQLIHIIHSSLSENMDEDNIEQIRQLLRSLSECKFNEEKDQDLINDLCILFDHPQLKETPELAQALVLCGMRIIANGKAMERTSLFEGHLFDQMLQRMKEIVEGPAWEKFDSMHGMDKTSLTLPAEDEEEVPHLKYAIKLPFEFNRRRIMVGILDLWTELHKEILPKIARVEPPYLDKLSDTHYYIPFVDFPEEWSFYRGISSKQGKKTCQQAALEALTMGCYTRTLVAGSHDGGNWSKRKEDLCGTFFTTDLEWANEPLYYDHENGALIEVSAQMINKERLGMNLRVEKEDGVYHVVSFGGKSKKTFDKIYLNYSWKASLDLIAGDPTLMELTQKYDALDRSQHKERKNLKKEIHLVLKNISAEFENPSHKAIFSTLTELQIWEIHRSLTNQDFYKEKVVFIQSKKFQRSSKEYFASKINPLTQNRLQKLNFIRSEYRKRFDSPFCLGQDEALLLPYIYFSKQVENISQLLFLFHKKMFGFLPQPSAEETTGDLLTFSEKVAHSFDEDMLDSELLKLLRIALYFKESPPSKLAKALKKPAAIQFFGFRENSSASHYIQTLVHLHQLYKREQPEKEIYLKYACSILNPKNCKMAETMKLLQLFVE